MYKTIKTLHWYIKLYTGGSHKLYVHGGVQDHGWYATINLYLFCVLVIKQ